MSILDDLEKESIFSITKNKDGTFRIYEECDLYFYMDLTSEQLIKLSEEIKELSLKDKTNV